MNLACTYCGLDVDPRSRTAWHRIVGWERKATASTRKSGSDIALREARNEYACNECIQRLKRGVAALQRDLW